MIHDLLDSLRAPVMVDWEARNPAPWRESGWVSTGVEGFGANTAEEAMTDLLGIMEERLAHYPGAELRFCLTVRNRGGAPGGTMDSCCLMGVGGGYGSSLGWTSWLRSAEEVRAVLR